MRRRTDEPDGLTPREWQVLALIREGLTNEQIAERLGISFGTAKYHVAEIISKLNADDRHDAVRKADERRFAPLVLAWLALLRRFGKPMAATAIAVMIAVSYVLLSGLLIGGSEGDSPVFEEAVGFDIAPETLAAVEAARLQTEFKQTLLLSNGEPQNVGTQGELIASLARVRTLAELQVLLTDDVKVIVIDESVEREISSSDFLYNQWEAGRAVVGLNLCFADLIESKAEAKTTPTSGGVVTEIAPDGTTRYYDPTNFPEEGPRCAWAYEVARAGHPYISYLPGRITGEEAEALRSQGHNVFGTGGGVGRLDLQAEYHCYISNLLSHLEAESPLPFDLPACP